MQCCFTQLFSVKTKFLSLHQLPSGGRTSPWTTECKRLGQSLDKKLGIGIQKKCLPIIAGLVYSICRIHQDFLN
jgi:hypothetical protein